PTGPVIQSKDYWRMETNCAVLGGAGSCIWSDTGVRYEFSSSSANSYNYGGTTLVWPVSRIVDPFGNAISVSYTGGQIACTNGAVQSITDSYNRPITFGYHFNRYTND